METLIIKIIQYILFFSNVPINSAHFGSIAYSNNVTSRISSTPTVLAIWSVWGIFLDRQKSQIWNSFKNTSFSADVYLCIAKKILRRMILFAKWNIQIIRNKTTETNEPNNNNNVCFLLQLFSNMNIIRFYGMTEQG